MYVTPSGPRPRGGVLQDAVTSDELRPGAVGEVVLGSKGRKRRRDAMRYGQLLWGLKPQTCAAHLGVSEIMVRAPRYSRGNSGPPRRQLNPLTLYL